MPLALGQLTRSIVRVDAVRGAELWDERLLAHASRAQHLDAIELHGLLMIILAGSIAKAVVAAAAAIVVAAQAQAAATAAAAVQAGHGIACMHRAHGGETVAARATPSEGVAAIDDACKREEERGV